MSRRQRYFCPDCRRVHDDSNEDQIKSKKAEQERLREQLVAKLKEAEAKLAQRRAAENKLARALADALVADAKEAVAREHTLAGVRMETTDLSLPD